MTGLKGLQEGIVNSQVWKSVFRVGIPNTNRKRVLAVLGSLILHLHPVKVRRSGVRMSYTWCMGGTSFFLFLVETVTGLLLMFYYRPTIEYAFTDIMDLREQAPFGIMREMHRWGAHAMVIAVWLHMFRVFMTGSYKPPREFNWNVGVILLVLTLLLSFTGYLLPWDQLAIWAITVGSNMARATPGAGNEGPMSGLIKLGDIRLIHAGDDARFALIAASAALSRLLLWLIAKIYFALGGSVTLGLAGASVVRLILSTLVLGVPTLLMGGTLPAAARAVETNDDAGRRRLALLYGANTLGAVAGTLLATFFMLETFGNRRTLLIAVLVNATVAIIARSMGREADVIPSVARELGEVGGAARPPRSLATLGMTNGALIAVPKSPRPYAPARNESPSGIPRPVGWPRSAARRSAAAWLRRSIVLRSSRSGHRHPHELTGRPRA